MKGKILLFIAGLIITYLVAININFERTKATFLGGDILYVGGSGEGNYSKIQDAINDADDGDIIFVYSGIYYENIIINKSISLIGESKETTIIDGNYEGNVVYISADGVSIEEFKIRNSGLQNVGIKTANNATIYSCNILNNGYGILLLTSFNNTIHGCEFENDGIIIAGNKLNHFLHNIYGNTVNGRPLLYYKNAENIVLDGNAGQIILINCSNFDVKNMNIKNLSIAIEIAYCNEISISNCSISKNDFGIFTYASRNNVIYNCNVLKNDLGILLLESYNNTIHGCEFENDGIFTWGYKLNHFLHNIYGNTVNGKPLLYYKNAENIVLDGNAGQIILINCSNFDVKNMNIKNLSIAIEIAYCNEISISNCSISNSWVAIWLYNAFKNTMRNCNISNNYLGIWLYNSSNNYIYLNDFINNENVYSCYSNNIWHSTKFIIYAYNGRWRINYLGNYWHDYNGRELNGDGIGDAPYYISYDDYDCYPLMQPCKNYRVIIETKMGFHGFLERINEVLHLIKPVKPKVKAMNLPLCGVLFSPNIPKV